MRQHIAQKAAQILLESGTRDFYAAKQKAAHQLGVNDTNALPNNTEVELALAEYQRLFHKTSQPEHLEKLRNISIEAMQFLAPFKWQPFQTNVFVLNRQRRAGMNLERQ